MTGRKRAEDPSEPEDALGDDAQLDGLDTEPIADLEADEETEDVFGGKGYVYTSSCHTR